MSEEAILENQQPVEETPTVESEVIWSEVISEQEQEVIANTEVQELSDDELDLSFLDEILWKKEEEPNFFSWENKIEEEEPTQEEKKEDEDEIVWEITTDDLEEMEKIFDELETSNKQFEEQVKSLEQKTIDFQNELDTLSQDLEIKNKALSESQELIETHTQVWNSLIEHKYLWKYVQDFLNGKDIAFPEIIKKSIDAEIDSLPNIIDVNWWEMKPIKKTWTTQSLIDWQRRPKMNI